MCHALWDPAGITTPAAFLESLQSYDSRLQLCRIQVAQPWSLNHVSPIRGYREGVMVKL